MNLKLSLAGAALAAGVLFATMPSHGSEYGIIRRIERSRRRTTLSGARRRGAGTALAGVARMAGTSM